MPSNAASRPLHSRTPRALLTAAFLALGSTLAAQPDFAAIKARASRGDAEALNTLGNAYANGQGVTRDDATALGYYRQAAEKGEASALFNMGMMYELGRGTAPDLSQAFKFYKQAADLGFAHAQCTVAKMYAAGRGIEANDAEAARWFRAAADKGLPEAQYCLATAYELGTGIQADDTQARAWHERAADHGYTRAIFQLGLLLEEGRGGPKDERAHGDSPHDRVVLRPGGADDLSSHERARSDHVSTVAVLASANPIARSEGRLPTDTSAVFRSAFSSFTVWPTT